MDRFFSLNKDFLSKNQQKENVFSHARLGRINTIHGSFDTPNFIFCATKASIKAIPTHCLKKLGCDIILSNTYHLLLTPGPQLIAKQGGLHGFMGWTGPMLTDSGGYQIFAMGHGSVAQELKRVRSYSKSVLSVYPPSLTSITEKGATFRSYFDGRKIELTPEKAVSVQCCLGADIIVQLDECTPYHVDKSYTASAMHRSVRWGDRSLSAFAECQSFSRQKPFEKSEGEHDYLSEGFFCVNPQQHMAGVVQGGIFRDLREESVAYVYDRPFDSVALGGSLGRNKKEMQEVVQMTMEIVRRHEDIASPKHRHLLGIGGIDDIFFAVEQGIDTFDCVHPTRVARHGAAIVPAAILEKDGKKGHMLNLRNAFCKDSSMPIDEGCEAQSSQYSRAYLHHLLKTKEIAALTILSEHNVAQMVRLLRDIRKAIAEGTMAQMRFFWLGY